MTDAILVIGGGIAGSNVAMNVAKYGVQVYLVDDTASIGGMMARLDKTFPTNDCSICIEAPQRRPAAQIVEAKVAQILAHPKI